MGDTAEETRNLFAPRPSNTLSRRARLACTRFKEAEFSQGYELGTKSVFRDTESMRKAVP